MIKLNKEKFESHEGFDYSTTSNAVDMIEIYQVTQQLVFQSVCCFSISLRFLLLTVEEWKILHNYKLKSDPNI